MNENNNTKPVLSICIPAYNQPNHLRGVLGSIAVALHGRKNEVEVIIHDDASPYADLREVAREFNDRINIRAVRHEKNIGFDLNTAGVAAEARGEFTWLLSDNDELLEGALDWFFGTIRNYPDIGYIYADRITEVDHLPPPGQKPEIVSSAGEFLMKHDLPGFISSQIFLTELWRSVDVKKYVGTLWVHAGVIMEFLPRTKILRSRQPLIRICTESTWVTKGRNLTAFLGLKEILGRLEQYGYEKEVVQFFDRRSARDLPEVLAYAKLRQLEVTSEVRTRVRRNFEHRPFSRAVAAVILSTPVAILKFFAPTFWYFKKMFTI